MAIRTWAAVWLALQLLPLTATTEDSERCTEIEASAPVTNEAALLQASVGKQKVTLVEIPDGSSSKAASAQVAGPTQPTAPVATVGVNQASLPPQSQPAAPQPKGQQPAQATAPQSSAEAADREEPEEVSLLLLARSSVMSILQHIAQRIRAASPVSLVYIFPAMKTDIGAVFGLSLVSFIIWCTLVAATACLYRSQKAFPRAISSRPEQDFNDWTSGPFDIFSDLRLCCWSCWCPCIRWADNMDMLGIVSFWVGLLAFCGLVLLNTVPGGLLLWLVASLLWMSFRQQLRLKFDMEQNTLRTFVGDCALYCCCWPCAIAQEARHIEEACRAAHKAVRKFEAV